MAERENGLAERFQALPVKEQKARRAMYGKFAELSLYGGESFQDLFTSEGQVRVASKAEDLGGMVEAVLKSSGAEVTQVEPQRGIAADSENLAMKTVRWRNNVGTDEVAVDELYLAFDDLRHEAGLLKEGEVTEKLGQLFYLSHPRQAVGIGYEDDRWGYRPLENIDRSQGTLEVYDDTLKALARATRNPEDYRVIMGILSIAGADTVDILPTYGGEPKQHAFCGVTIVRKSPAAQSV